MKKEKQNLFNCTYSQLKKLIQHMGEPSFRADQLIDWFYKKLIFNPNDMGNIPATLKQKIENSFSLYLPKISDISHSAEDNSYKFLLSTDDNKLIESILMIDKKHATLCVSCMIGCPLRCRFCATGSQIGFIRKLSTAEIIGQVLMALEYARTHKITDKITNIVFMGMGEPLLNQDAVKKTIELLTHEKCCALSPSKISVSTAGVATGIADFIHKTGVRLAVSLHFPTNELRSQYMPVNKGFPLEDLIAELRTVKLKKRDSILVEYLMLKGINDSLEHAKQLVRLISNLKTKVNLIPYNPTATLPAQAPDEETLNRFARYLQNKGIFTTVRRSKGLEVEGGCGQFALKQQKKAERVKGESFKSFITDKNK